MSEFLNEINEIMASIANVSKTQCLWKNPAGGSGIKGLLKQHYEHKNNFCMAVKNSGNLSRECKKNDDEKIPQCCYSCRNQFINVCHAGVAEYVTPIFLQDRYEGSLLLGPFYTQDSPVKPNGRKKELSELPKLTPELIKLVQPLLSLTAKYIVGYRQKLGTGYISIKNIKDSRIKVALEYMINHYSSCTIASVASKSGLSESRFIHLFKTITGRNYSDYIIELRVEEAKRRLLETAEPISEITFAVGLSSQSYFGAAFSRLTGMTPREFRKRFQEKIVP